jgi:hypothetical protein
LIQAADRSVHGSHLLPPRIYFYNSGEPENLQDDIIALAEGFRALGIPYHSRCNYWRLHPDRDDWLFTASPDVSPLDCDVVVYPCTYFYWIAMGTFKLQERPLPREMFQTGRRHRNVLCDFLDGHRTISWRPEFRSFDLILRAKLNRRAWHPGNMQPWTLSLSNRVIEHTAGGPEFSQRRPVCLVNFGGSHPYPHGSRDRAEKCFHPLLEKFLPLDRTIDNLAGAPQDPVERLLWEQTGHRFSASYYARVKSAQAVSCFCGELVPPLPWRDPSTLLRGGNKAKLRRKFYRFLAAFDPRPERIVQWDSFRFWETLAAGSVAFHLDLDRYGVTLPVMPQNWVHYIGIDLDRPAAAIERLRADPDQLATIAANGRAWALEHYSPRATATRFLSLL